MKRSFLTRGFRKRAQTAAVLAAPALCLALSPSLADSAEAQTLDSPPEYAQLAVTVFPFLGASTTPLEQRLPFAPMAGFRVTGELWNHVAPSVRIGVFLGGGATLIAVSERTDCRTGSCGGSQTDLGLSYLATVEGGFTADMPGRPYVLGFLGRAFPSEAKDYDLARREYNQVLSATWGFGGGAWINSGGISIQVEARFRRDKRYLTTEDDALEILLGVPLRSS